jgi:DGQHR domain-containing protein
MSTITIGPTISPRQGGAARVVCFTATAKDIAGIARIDRIGRDAKGRLRGFQRPQIASHIREISNYLASSDSILPNAIVLAFQGGAQLKRDGTLLVDVSDGPPGWVVDGQQRLTAALSLARDDFELIVSAFICDDMAELKRQFILVNNTRPLAKPLIYELLPGIGGLPNRLADRTGAAVLIEALNYRDESSLHGMIQQQTNPDGVIRDTILQRMLINSMQHGALRSRGGDVGMFERFGLVSRFFDAVQRVFGDDWHEHDAKTSRLLHGVGIISMGYVMDELYVRRRARKTKDFQRGLRALVGRTHWTSGNWTFGSERRSWNSLQNTATDYRLLSDHLVRLIRRA